MVQDTVVYALNLTANTIIIHYSCLVGVSGHGKRHNVGLLVVRTSYMCGESTSEPRSRAPKSPWNLASIEKVAHSH